MIRRANWFLIGIVAIFAFALWVLLPLDSDRFGRQGIQFGLDLEGGVRLVYQADLSSVEPGTEDQIMDGVSRRNVSGVRRCSNFVSIKKSLLVVKRSR